jgi:hypothetical protein
MSLELKLLQWIHASYRDEDDCHRPNGELCPQCRERRRLRHDLIDILTTETKLTAEDIAAIHNV